MRKKLKKNVNNAKLIKINPTFKEAIEELVKRTFEVKEIDNPKLEDEKGGDDEN